MSDDIHDFAALTDVGRARPHNEDAVLAQPPLFAVADGVGGAAAGEVASSTAVEALARAVATMIGHDEDASVVLTHAMTEANEHVHAAQHAQPDRADMATTMTAVIVTAPDEVVIGHVGDSRAYAISAHEVRQITDDHSVVGELVRSGQITEQDARTHPRRNVILRALDGAPHLSVDTYRAHIPAGGWVLLCSDGLHGLVDPDEIGNVVTRAPDARTAAQQLIDLANTRGGTDNISTVLIQLTAPPPGGDAPSALDGVPYSDPSPDRFRISRRARMTILSALIAAIVIAFVVVAWTQSYYLVTRANGDVGVNRGFPIFGLHTSYRTSNVKADSLSDYDHNRLLTGHRLRDKADIEQILDQLSPESDAQ